MALIFTWRPIAHCSRKGNDMSAHSAKCLASWHPNKSKIARELMRDRLRTGYSYSPGSLPSAVNNAVSAVRIGNKWDSAESADLVRVRIEADEFCSFDDLAGDCYSESPDNVSSVPGGLRAIRAQRKEFESMTERDGACGTGSVDESGHGKPPTGVIQGNCDALQCRICAQSSMAPSRARASSNSSIMS